jgi:hypothetical protein
MCKFGACALQAHVALRRQETTREASIALSLGLHGVKRSNRSLGARSTWIGNATEFMKCSGIGRAPPASSTRRHARKNPGRPLSKKTVIAVLRESNGR